MKTDEAILAIQQLYGVNSPPEELQTNSRNLLRQLYPLQVLNLFFSARYRQLLPDDLRRAFPETKKRRDVLRWVYGESTFVDDVTYVRLPSEEKRLLASAICDAAHSRFSWLTPRRLHAFAYRPESFSGRREMGSRDWGQLYKKVVIPKGSAKRILFVPNRPLRRVQKIILNRVLSPALSCLLAGVNGCRPRDGSDNQYGIYRNAAAHLGQAFVASFDLKDFFPSIKVDDIIPALLSLDSPMLTVGDTSGATGHRNLRWTHDCSVLVSRLATFRGCLPQGAPTSPAIANIVFDRYDQLIAERLPRECVVTRYVDDITVSLSHGAASRLGLRTTQAVQAFIQTTLLDVLKNSPFRLNPNKTRCSRLASGHKITGLSVKDRSVSVPRSKKREIRNLLFRIRKDGFVPTACSLIGADVVAQSEYLTAGQGSVQKYRSQHRRHGTRLSLERSAIRLLRTRYANLRVEVPEKTFNFGGDRVFQPVKLLEGRAAWRSIERLLTALWRSLADVAFDNGHMNITQRDGSLICRVRSEPDLTFLQLSRREAICTIELWNRLYGTASALNVKDPDACFDPVRQQRNSILDVLSTIDMHRDSPPTRIHPVDLVAGVGATSQPVAITPFEREANQLKALSDLIARYAREILGDTRFAAASVIEPVLITPAETREQLRLWFRHCVDLLKTLNKLPKTFLAYHAGFGLLEICDDRMSGKRNAVYVAEHRFLKGIRPTVDRLDEIDDSHALSAQATITANIQQCFKQTVDEFESVRGKERNALFNRLLEESESSRSVTSRLNRAIDEYGALHRAAVWRSSGESVFASADGDQLLDDLEEFRSAIRGRTWNGVWKSLFRSCASLNRSLYDSIDNCPHSELRPYRQLNNEIGKSHRPLTIIYYMRCRDAHPRHLPAKDADRILDEWLSIQRFAAEKLRRIWKAGDRGVNQDKLFEEHSDLKLTPHEGNLVKLALLEGANQALLELQPSK